MKSRVLGIAVAVGLALMIGPGAARADGPLTPVHIGVLPNDDMISVLYAQRSGLFTKAGLDVTLEKSTSGAAIAAAVISGSFDIGKSSITPLFDAHEKGIPFVIIAAGAIYESKAPYGGLAVGKDQLANGKDLEGKIIGINSLNDIGHVAINAWVDQNGGDPKALKYVEVPMPVVPAAIEANRVSGGEMVFPPLAAALASGKVKLIPAFSAIAPSFLFSVWFTTKDYSAKHPDAIKTFARVVADAARYTNAHHAETAKLLSDYTTIPVESIEHMTRVTNGTSVSASQIQPVIDAAVKYGNVKKSFPAHELIDPLIATK